jgi:hypothetical protein
MRDSHVANELQIVTANMLTATVRQQMVVIWLEALCVLHSTKCSLIKLLRETLKKK